MEDLNKLLNITDTYPMQLEQMTEEFLYKLRGILWGQTAIAIEKVKLEDLPEPSPHQTLKRVKRLSSLTEDNEIEEKLENPTDDGKSAKQSSPKKNKRSNLDLLAAAESVENSTVANKPVVTAPKSVENMTVANKTLITAPKTQKENTAVNDKEQTALQEVLSNSDGTILMPPPLAPITPAEDISHKRPQRAAKLKSEKNLKEPQLRAKLRRPTNEIKIKLEHEQRPSQMHVPSSESSKHSVLMELNDNIIKSSLPGETSDDSVCIVPGKKASIVSINSDLSIAPSSIDASSNKQPAKSPMNTENRSNDSKIREVCIKIKREKLSLENQEDAAQKVSGDAVFKLPALISPAVIPTSGHTSLINSTLSTTSNTTTTIVPKNTRKKRDVAHKPIKVERFSDLDNKPAPVSSRTRNGSADKCDNIETLLTKEPPPISNTKEINADTGTDSAVDESTKGAAADAKMNAEPTSNDTTFSTNPAQTTFQITSGQTTFVMEPNPNATITLKKHSGSGPPSDTTFDVHQVSKTSKDNKDGDIVGQHSFETAKDTSLTNENSLLTEDSSLSSNGDNNAKKVTKVTMSAKSVYKMPTRTNELFNPLAQSPVKMRVEAFENAAAAATEQSKRPLRSKNEKVMPSTTTTPITGRLPAPALGRFLTPTQSSNLPSGNSVAAKKTATSASKALPPPKSVCSSSLQRSNSTASTRTLQRENSADDFRKGLHSLAEERKKQREQKHLLAAQQRESKQRERTERMAKLAKEREEKRKLKKQQEQEQKKRELEEIQRKLRQQKEEEEEANKLKAAKEREMILQMKQQQQQLAKQKMLPPQPKACSSKYNFEMLHEDDSTDDEDKVSYKRPPPPSWSRSHVRGPFMLKQEYVPPACIDSFFSVQPMTPDLKLIFPNIDARHLKRNSSVLWSTPPRYSELPKY